LDSYSISYTGEVEKITGDRDSLNLRNLPTFSIEVTSLGASSFDIPPQSADVSSKPVGWKPNVLGHHNR
jgi:hypothetical protein